MQQLSLVLNGLWADHEAMVPNAAPSIDRRDRSRGPIDQPADRTVSPGFRLVGSTSRARIASNEGLTARRSGAADRRRVERPGAEVDHGVSLASVLERAGSLSADLPWDPARIQLLNDFVALLLRVAVADEERRPLPDRSDTPELHLRVLGWIAARTVSSPAVLDPAQASQLESLLDSLLA